MVPNEIKYETIATHWIDSDPYHTVLSIHINPKPRILSDGQMIMGYPALYLLE